MLYSKLFVLIGLLILISAQVTSACQCDDYDVPICSFYTRADVVFLGKVKKVDLGYNNSSRIQFQIEKNYKGNPNSNLNVYYDFGTTCSISPESFKENDTWLVFGYQNGNLISMPFCSGSHHVDSNDEFVEFLNNYTEGKTKEFVMGKLMVSWDKVIKNAIVGVIGNNKNYSTKTDDQGFFKIEVSKNGVYKVKINVPLYYNLMTYSNGYKIRTKKKEFDYEAKIEKGLCDYRQLKFNRVNLKNHNINLFNLIFPNLYSS